MSKASSSSTPKSSDPVTGPQHRSSVKVKALDLQEKVDLNRNEAEDADRRPQEIELFPEGTDVYYSTAKKGWDPNPCKIDHCFGSGWYKLKREDGQLIEGKFPQADLQKKKA